MAKLSLIYNGLNQKLIKLINFLDGSTLADNLIKNCKIDYLSSVSISVEATENDQEHLATVRYRITSLV